MAAKQKIDIEEYQDSVQQLHWERRQLHNKIQDMKGFFVFLNIIELQLSEVIRILKDETNYFVLRVGNLDNCSSIKAYFILVSIVIDYLQF